MKYLIVLLLWINPLNFIGSINQLQRDAESAFKEKEYFIAILKYKQLIETYAVRDDKIYLNLAHAYYLTQEREKSTQYYLEAIKSGGSTSKSLALNQLACIEFEKGKLVDALNLFKEAILNNPLNYKARYNYELLKKQLKNAKTKKTPPKQKSGKDKKDTESSEKSLQSQIEEETTRQKENQNTSEEGEEQSNQGDKKNLQGNKDLLQPQKLEEIKLNKEKAEAILEALKNQEIQYIQQLKRRVNRRNAKKSTSKW